MGYIGNRPTAVPLTSADIQDGSVDSSELVDNSVTLAKMAGLARGKLIYGDASGDPAALAVGGADEVLTHDGTDFDWAAAGGGAWTHIVTKTASSSAYIDFVDGASGVVFDGTYKMYCIQAINIEVQNNNTEMYVYTSNDGGSSYETSYDALAVRGFNWLTTPHTLHITNAIAHLGSVGNAGGKACGITLWIPDPADTSTYHYVYGQGFTLDDGGTFRIAAATGGAHETAEAFNAIKFQQTSGNINTGIFSLYGITT